jgi:hypothetical protein
LKLTPHWRDASSERADVIRSSIPTIGFYKLRDDGRQGRSNKHHSSSSNTMTTNEIPIPRDPTEDEALALFKAVEERFPAKTLGDNKWYVLLVCISLSAQ